MLLFFVFFFSSRRRHTRCSRDWSSDVCSSDLLDREGNLEYARHADDGRHADVAFVRPRKGFLHHEVGDLAIELRGDDREPHVRVTWSGPASANPSRGPVPARARIAAGRNRRSYAFAACSRVRRSNKPASSASSEASSSCTMTPRMCLPIWACTAWRPKSAARAQSLSTGWRPTIPSAITRSQPRSNRIRAPAARSLMPGTVYRSTAKPSPCFRSSSIAAEAMSYRENEVSTIPIRFRRFALGWSKRPPSCLRPARGRGSGASTIGTRGRAGMIVSCLTSRAVLPRGTPPQSAAPSARPRGGNTHDRDGGDRRPPSPLHGPQTPRSDDVLPFQEHEIPRPSICLCILLRESSSVVRHHLADGRGGREPRHEHEGRREFGVAPSFDEERLNGVQEGHVPGRPKFFSEHVGRPSVLPFRRFLRDRRESRDRLGPVHIRHAGEGVAVIDGDREGAVPIVFHVFPGDRLEDRELGPGSPEDVRHEREADSSTDFAREGCADQTARLLAKRADGFRRHELAGNREVRFLFAAIAVVHEDEFASLKGGHRACEIHEI